MQFIPKDRILEHRHDTLLAIRKEFDLEKPGQMESAIKILKEWLEKQHHFKKKDFSDFFLETTIVVCKGSLERAKTQLDRMCTSRTVLPQFYKIYNVKTDFAYMFKIITPIVLPKLTPDHHRVILIKINKNIFLMKDHFHFFVYNMILAIYLKNHDYCRGFYIISDFTEINLMDFLPNINPVVVRQALSLFIECHGMRVKGIHIFSSSKLIDSFITLMKQVTSPKVGGRIYTHKKLEELKNVLPLEILPEEYGGKERSIKVLLGEWIDALSSKEHLECLEELSKAGTDEAYRRADKFNEQYAGMPGTFRLLSVD